MSYPTFIWYPDGGSMAASREDTSLGEEVSDLQVNPARARTTGTAISGRHSSTVLSTAMEEIRIVVENMSGGTTGTLIRHLSAMQAHLERGSAIGFTRDTSKAWAGYATTAPARGDTVLYTGGDVWYYSGTAALAVGDEICIEGLGAEGKREYAIVDSVSGSNITLTTGLLYSYNDATVMVRWRDYYPVLVWPESYLGSRVPIFTHDRRLNYTLDITLETDPAVAASLYSAEDAGEMLIGATAGTGSLSLNDLQDAYDLDAGPLGPLAPLSSNVRDSDVLG